MRLGGRTLALIVALLGATGFCGCAHVGQTLEAPAGPDLRGVLRVSGRFGMGHACPIGPTRALTAAHVVDPYPTFERPGIQNLTWSDGEGADGFLVTSLTSMHRDLAIVRPTRGTFARVYSIAAEAPAPGSRVHVLSYDWSSPQRAMAPRAVRPTVVRIEARQIVLRFPTGPGSSGGCVLNDAGELVGILEGYVPTDDGRAIGTAVGVWGEKDASQ